MSDSEPSLDLADKILAVIEAHDPKGENVADSLHALTTVLVLLARHAGVQPHTVIMKVAEACGGQVKSITAIPIPGTGPSKVN